MHALGLFDADADPVFEALVTLAERLGDGRCELWLPGADGLRPVTGPVADPDAWITGPSVVEEVVVDDVTVGQVRGDGIDPVAVRRTADLVASTLADRWLAARLDGNGDPVGAVVIGPDLRVLWASDEAFALGLGDDGETLVGAAVVDLVDADDVRSLAPILERGLGGRGRTSVVTTHLRVRRGDPVRFDVWGDNRLADPEVGAITFGVRRADETTGELRLLGDQMWVLNRLSGGQPLGEVLHRVTDMVEHRDPFARVCITELEDGALHPLIAPHLPIPVVGALIGLEVGPGAPAGGGSVHVDLSQYTANVGADPAYAALAPTLLEHGLKACWSIPIRSFNDGTILGTVDVFRSTVGNPSDADTRVLVLAARLAAIAMDHDMRERALRHQAMHDPLTDLPNRAMFSERLEAAAEDGNVGVLFVDLDRFKLVNDTLGHEFGDEVLQVVGRRMQEAIDEPVTVARFGGDEFTVLVPKVEVAADLVAVGERLLATIAEPFDVRGHRVVLGASIGAVLANGRPDDPQSLVRDADTALYHAKERGRGRIEVFDDRMREADAERVRIEGLMRDAIDHDRVEAHFQPTVRVVDGRVVGAEALARCRTADGDLLPPAQFIPVAEEVGLLSSVFRTVLTQACEMANTCNQARIDPFIVWVNLAATQLGSAVVVDQICRVFEETGVDATRIGFEVTESGIIPDPEDAAEFLGRLKALGAHVAIDDFGTGYSSLGYLQALPVDTVKLDRSFVIRAGDDPRSRAIVRSIVELTKAMDLSCVAEGVETVEQLDVVTELGCTLVQGFVYARPAPADAFLEWMSTRP